MIPKRFDELRERGKRRMSFENMKKLLERRELRRKFTENEREFILDEARKLRRMGKGVSEKEFSKMTKKLKKSWNDPLDTKDVKRLEKGFGVGVEKEPESSDIPERQESPDINAEENKR